MVYDYQQRALEARAGHAIRHVLGFVDTWEDSRDRIRKPVLYPLSYGAGGAEDTPPPAASPSGALDHACDGLGVRPGAGTPAVDLT